MRLAGKEKKGRLTPIMERTGRVKPEEAEAGGEEENRGKGGKQKEGLEPGWGFLGVAAMRMSFGQKTKGRPVQDGPLEIKSWRCSTFPRKNAQYHRRWRA